MILDLLDMFVLYRKTLRSFLWKLLFYLLVVLFPQHLNQFYLTEHLDLLKFQIFAFENTVQTLKSLKTLVDHVIMASVGSVTE